MKFNVHQIYFQNWQLEGLEKAFAPYDNSGCPNPDLREFYVFRKEYLAGKVRPDEYTGYVSWKFRDKTGLSGQQFIDFCQANPGYDVYFINPFPLAIHLGNVWNHGRFHHPEIQELAQFVMDMVGYRIDLSQLPVNLRTTAFCNFWVGNKAFWDKYMAFCLPIYDYILNEMPEPYKSRIFSRADRRIKASYFSFIFERLFTTFLVAHPEIRTFGYSYNEKELLQKYTPEEAAIVSEVQALETRYPDLAEPIRQSPITMAALHYYYDSRCNKQHLKSVLYLAGQLCWHLVPFRARLLRNPRVRQFSERVLTLLQATKSPI